MAKANPCVLPAPKSKSASTATRVVTDVINVRDMVWLTLRSISSAIGRLL